MFESNSSVIIRGGGIAAWCCAFLLKKAGIHVVVEDTGRAKLPAILLSDAARALIRDIFETPTLFHDQLALHKRVVAWGTNSTPMSLDHSAIVVSEEVLLKNIRSIVGVQSARGETVKPDWIIAASHPLPAGCREYSFGTRTGVVAPVELAVESALASCWIEALEDGWLFLIESGPSAGWLLAVGNTLHSLLCRSAVIQKRIKSCGTASGDIPVYPRFSAPLCDLRWLSCGSAAMAFDPICGDGTAHAIREAILVAAVIRAAAKDGADIRGLLSHYETRLLAAFRRHLAMCLEFYSRGGHGTWWDEECAALKSGLQWCDSKLGDSPTFRYRLEGFELHTVR